MWRLVRASMSIVGMVPPVMEDGELLVDGGYLNNIPVDVMRGLGVGTGGCLRVHLCDHPIQCLRHFHLWVVVRGPCRCRIHVTMDYTSARDVNRRLSDGPRYSNVHFSELYSLCSDRCGR